MTPSAVDIQSWERFQRYYSAFPELGLSLDVSRVAFPESFLEAMEAPMQGVYASMDQLEAGAIANPTEGRRVGHYWLREPGLAPEAGIRAEIQATLARIRAFAKEVHEGRVTGESGPFKHLLVVGIGGSALGPQFVHRALGHPQADRLQTRYFDNTDPDGMDRVLAEVGRELGQMLCVVISKSGGTKETANGMKEAKAAYERAGLRFERHAVAITMASSKLDRQARGIEPAGPAWLDIFPMWDWVGGRTSEMSAVGLLPAALQGLDIEAMLAGARACDVVTRSHETRRNPAAMLALMWYHLGQGRGGRDMVVIPYKDRLELLARYLQQLVMESLGKERDSTGRIVNQGLSVYGNKGSTDQHAYIQQLRDGLHNFFVVFIEVLRDRTEASLAVEPGVTSGDYLSGFLLGTRQALWESGRQSLTLTLQEVSPRTVGGLIALFERAVGFYALLVNINAYDQPGVQAGKVAADAVLAVQLEVSKWLRGEEAGPTRPPATAAEIAEAVGADPEAVFKICEHLAANPDRGIRRSGDQGPATTRYSTGTTE